MSFFGMFKKTKKEISLILDIGSGSVGVAVVLFSENNHPKILHVERESLPVGIRVSSDKLLSQMETVLKSVLSSVSKNINSKKINSLKNIKIRRTSCVFSSPWYVSTMKSFHLEQDSSFVFTKHLTDEILKKEEREFEKEATNSFDTNVSNSTPYVLERNITQVFLNGYETSNPYCKKSKTADLSIYLSLSPQEPVKLVQNAIHNYFGVKRVDFHSFPFVTYNAIRDNFSDEDNFVFMDIASEVTDIILVRNGSIVKIVSFPIGKNLLVRNVMNMMGIPAEVALSYLKMYAEKTSDINLRNELESAINEAEKKWLEYFNENAIKLGVSMHGVSKIFVTVDSDVSELCARFIKKERESAWPGLGAIITTVILDNDKIDHVVSSDTSVSIKDPFLSLESIYFDKLFKHFEKNN